MSRDVAQLVGTQKIFFFILCFANVTCYLVRIALEGREKIRKAFCQCFLLVATRQGIKRNNFYVRHATFSRSFSLATRETVPLISHKESDGLGGGGGVLMSQYILRGCWWAG